MDKLQMIREAFEFSKFYYKVKSWYSKHTKELYSVCNPYDNYDKGTADASEMCYGHILNMIKENPEEVSAKFIERVCKEYKKTVASYIASFLSINHIVPAGSTRQDDGSRVLVCPYDLPKDYYNYSKMCM